jgi:hypothetical protein
LFGHGGYLRDKLGSAGGTSKGAGTKEIPLLLLIVFLTSGGIAYHDGNYVYEGTDGTIL